MEFRNVDRGRDFLQEDLRSKGEEEQSGLVRYRMGSWCQEILGCELEEQIGRLVLSFACWAQLFNSLSDPLFQEMASHSSQDKIQTSLLARKVFCDMVLCILKPTPFNTMHLKLLPFVLKTFLILQHVVILEPVCVSAQTPFLESTW